MKRKKESRQSSVITIKNALWRNKGSILVLAIFALEFFLRFYQMAERNPFGWDEVDNAWAAKNLIINHRFPLNGMVAKQNSGIFIGPAYYYLIAIFYWIYNLSPIASGVFAGLSSFFGFWVLFYCAKKLFSFPVGVIAVFIQTFAMNAIIFDRIQWPVDFIPSVSLLIFYFLYKVIKGNPKSLIGLALATGFMFHVHFTAIFFPIIILLCLPFFPRTKETLKYALVAISLFVICFIPTIFYMFQTAGTNTHSAGYLNTYYHGFHLRRVMQLLGDALIQFNPFLFFPQLYVLKFFLTPIFFFVYLYKKFIKERILLCYLISLWFIVPWFVFATYSGEISDYYFAVNRFLCVIIVAYLLSRIFSLSNIFPKIAVVAVLIYYAYVNIQAYFLSKDTTLLQREEKVLDAINRGETINYQQGIPESYLFYYYMRQKGIVVYDKK